MNLAISKINPINYKKFNSFKHSANKQKYQSCNTMSFLANISNQKKAELEAKNYKEYSFKDFLAHEGKITKSEYSDIKKNNPDIISQAQRYCDTFYCGDITPQDIAEISIRSDNYLRRIYKDYRIISLGTSPSPITEQLANLGHEVVFLPISGLKGCTLLLSDTKNSKELHSLLEYLESKNINDEKLNIILDYTATGSTLDKMTDFIKEYFSLQNKYIKKLSVQNFLNSVFGSRDYYFQNAYHSKVKQIEAYRNDMFNSLIERISNVPHFPITEGKVIFLDDNLSKQDLFKQFENYSTPLARAFSLSTMSEIDKLINFHYLKFML